MRAANSAMIQAKSLGRNQYSFYSPTMNARALEMLVLENDLRVALDGHQFELYYQPQVSLRDPALVIGAEALLRWNHPTKGLIPPGDFIALAEETDLIIFCEMFTTGFTMNTTGMGEPMDGPCIQWMKKLAASRKCAVCGSLIIFENHQYFNRFVFVHPNGKIAHYDKAHLFNLANEGE